LIISKRFDWQRFGGLSARFQTATASGPNHLGQTFSSSCCGFRDNQFIRAAPTSFRLPRRSIAIPPHSSTRRCDEFRAATFNEVSGLGDDALQEFENLARAGFPVNEFWERREKRGILLDCSGDA
jgi:hypothetical protein